LECGGSTPLWIALGLLGRCLVGLAPLKAASSRRTPYCGDPLHWEALTAIFNMLTMRQSKETIEERLRSEKAMRAAPHGFTERVMSRLPEGPTADRERVPTFAIWPRFALAIALIVILAVFAFEFAKPKFSPLTASTHQPASVATSGYPESQMTAADLAIPVITPEQIQALTVKLDDPLEKELNNVISDTRQAIQFVALNFLPEK
jgi:hypothetical protein